jgi:hypothetical protein
MRQGVNEGLISTDVAPSGEMKESDNGRERSKNGIDAIPKQNIFAWGGLQLLRFLALRNVE